MKSLTCEMCNGTDIVKQDGFFVCQICGTKYSVEEAKKMMIEGTVDVSGSTVRVDNSDFVEKFLSNARRAKQKEDWEETEKYYNLVEQNDPTNIEAIFYSAYGKAMSSLIDSDLYKRQATFKVLTNCVSLLDDNFSIAEEEENRKTICQISSDILAMASSSYVYKQKTNGYGMVVSSEKNQTVTLFNTLGLEFVNTLEHIIAKYPDGDNRTIPFYEVAVKHAEFILKNGTPAYPGAIKKRIAELHTAWSRVDASHEVPKAFSPVDPTTEGKDNFAMIGLIMGVVAVALIAFTIYFCVFRKPY